MLVIPPVSRRAISVSASKRERSPISLSRIAGPGNEASARQKMITRARLSSFLPLHIRVALCDKTENAACPSKRVGNRSSSYQRNATSDVTHSTPRTGDSIYEM